MSTNALVFNPKGDQYNDHACDMKTIKASLIALFLGGLKVRGLALLYSMF